MPLVDLVDDTFVVADPVVVAAVVHDTARWARWWPDLRLTVLMDRGLKGLRWSVDGALHGSCELWLEAYADGVVVHYYLRADPSEERSAPRGGDRRRADRLRRERAVAWKRSVNALKDELEGDRAPGEPAVKGTPHTAEDR